jgi:four helix bundle protein
MSFQFEQLTVYQNARKLVQEVYVLIKKFPQEEKFALGNQLRRCVTSVPINIAEGSGSAFKKDNARFLNIANRSLSETVAILQLSSDLHLIDVSEYERLYEKFEILAKQLTALRQSKLKK